MKSTVNDEPEPIEEALKPKDPVRVFRGEGEVIHDLFKLESANFQKNIGLPNRPRWEPTAHCHYFHTRDGSGRPQKYASSIGGHTHEVIVKTDEQGNLIAECGPAVRLHRNNREDKFPNDEHTHDVKYLVSEKIPVKRPSKEAVAEISYLQSKLS